MTIAVAIARGVPLAQHLLAWALDPIAR